MGKKTLILATATEYIFSWITLYYQSLVQHNVRESFDLVILTFPSAFSKEGKKCLRKMGVIIFEDDMRLITISKFNSAFAESKNIYRLKHLGKAYLCDKYLRNNDMSPYDHLIVSDLDIIFQAPLEEIVHGKPMGRIFGAQEIRPLKNSPFLVRKLNNASKLSQFHNKQFDMERHEINYGFFWGELRTAAGFISAFLGYMNLDSLQPLLESETGDFHGYHEQDFLRLFLQDRGYEAIDLVESDILVHLSQNDQSSDILRIDPVGKRDTGGFIFPKVVHFAGGVWEMFPEIQAFLFLNNLNRNDNDLSKYWSGLSIGIDPQGEIYKIRNKDYTDISSDYRKALRYRKKGEPEKASVLLRPLLSDDNMAFDASIQLGFSLLEDGQVTEGLLCLKSVTENIPEYGNINYRIALALEKLNENAAAIEILGKLTSCFEENYDFFISYIKILLKTGETDKARQIFRRYKSVASTHHVFKDIECYILLNDLEEAANLCLDTLASWPTWTEVKIKLSHIYIKMKQYEDAIRVFDEIVREAPERDDIGLKYVEVLLRAGSRAEALTLYGKLVSEPGDKFDYYQNAIILRLMGEHGKEIESLKKAQIRAPLDEKIKRDIENADYRYGCILKNRSEYLQAIHYLGKVERANENYYNAKKLIADVIAQIGVSAQKENNHALATEKYRESLECFKQIYAENPGQNEILLNISDVYKYLKDYENALYYLEMFALEQGESDMLEAKREKIRTDFKIFNRTQGQGGCTI